MFGVKRGVGRKSEDHKVSNNRLRAYHIDRRVIPRVKECLGHFSKGYKPDVEELVNYLQTKYHEYSRKQRKAFKTTVQRAYQVICKQTEEEEQLQELEERFLHTRRNSSDFRNLVDGDDDHENERGIQKPSELSSDSELSCEDQPPMDLVQSQETNLMNKSMHEMYKLTSLQPGDEKGAEQTKDPFTSGAELKDNLPSQASQPGTAPNQSPTVETSFPPRLPGTSYSARSHLESSKATAYHVEYSTTGPNGGVKRKKNSLTEERKKVPGSVQSRRRQQHSQTGLDSKNDKEKKPQENPEFVPIHSSVRFSDIGGCDKTLEQVCKLLVHMRHPEVFQTLGITPPRGFLLHGPPGCGKTLLAHAIAGELEMPFIKIAATEIVSGVSGESEEKVRELFSRAVAHSPCVLFLDEIDSITPKRETASKDMERRIVSQLLTCMDDLNSNSDAQVLLIGATNRPDSLDPALRRAGRFDQEISMGIPDEKARERILRVLCNKLKLEENFSFASLAHLAPGFVGADLMALTREAALVAVNRVFQDLQKNARSNDQIDKCSGRENILDEGKGMVEASKTTATFSVIEWIRGISPLGSAELEKLCISMEDFKEALAIVQPSAKREGFATIPDVTWADVGALKDAREELSMAILAPVKYPAEFQALGLTHPPGILLAGPPGCGKTLLAKAIANESGINFISVKGPELLNMYVGESERAVRQVFQRARNSAPCVIFFDELDALCPRRSSSAESSASVRVVNQLLTEMDGLVARKQVFIMGATNRPDIIDPAVMRPGRLDKVLYVGFPTSEDREDILRTLTKDGQKPHLLPDVSIKELACDERCNGFSGADLAALVREACMAALRECFNVQSACSVSLENHLRQTEAPVGVGQRHFVAAFEKVKPSVSQKDRLMYEQMKHLSTKM